MIKIFKGRSSMLDETASQFNANPDDMNNDMNDIRGDKYEDIANDVQWQRVYDVIDKAEAGYRRAGAKRVYALRKLMQEKPAQNAYTICRYFNDDNLRIAVRFTMFEPMNEDFYRNHHPVLQKVFSGLPDGFSGYFQIKNKNGSSQNFIGTKYIVDKHVDSSSDSSGVDRSEEYDVIETLIIEPESVEFAYNPDDISNDMNDIRGDEYESGVDETMNEDDADGVKCDFPAWAVDYVVNAEIGQLSRQEKNMVDSWIAQMDQNGYDASLIQFGDDEFFSSDPEFGLPCECVTATVLKKPYLNESCSSDPVRRYLDFNF